MSQNVIFQIIVNRTAYEKEKDILSNKSCNLNFRMLWDFLNTLLKNLYIIFIYFFIFNQLQQNYDDNPIVIKLFNFLYNCHLVFVV